MNSLFCFGFGYCAEALASRLATRGWRITGTSRSVEGAARISRMGYRGLVSGGGADDPDLPVALAEASHLLISAAPDADGDPILGDGTDTWRPAPSLEWIGYLSTIGVYGDTQGAWVDEQTPPNPMQERARRRLAAEQAWLDFGTRFSRKVQIFRLAGIYGPGRSVIDDLKAGSARRIVKPGQVFNRIHVADIAQTLEAAIRLGAPGQVYNLTDDEPASSEAVLLFAAQLLGLEPPPATPIELATLSPMAASFYADNRRVRNERIKQELGVKLTYPTYREGLWALVQSGKTS